MNDDQGKISSHFTRCRSGFTMIEMVTSLVILAILLLACGSVVSLASYTINQSSTRTASQIQGGDAVSQLTDDLNVALNFTERTATSTTFTVPDRLNAGSPQTVRYAWGGAGTALTRQFNAGPAVPIITSAQSLALTYLTRQMGPAPEAIRFQHNTVLLGSAQSFKLDNKHWIAQYFQPTLPTGTTSWTLTRVQLMFQAGPPTAWTPVLVIMPDANLLPNGAVLAQTNIYSSAMSSNWEMVDATFAGLSKLSPSQGLCIEVQYNNGSGTNSGVQLQYESALLSILSNTCFSTSSNTGVTWAASGLGTSVAMMNVYGTVP